MARVLDVEVLYFECVVADEVPAFLHVTTHQDTKESVGLACVVELNAQQCSCNRIHRRIPQLVSVHLAQTLKTLYLNSLAADLPYGRANVTK